MLCDILGRLLVGIAKVGHVLVEELQDNVDRDLEMATNLPGLRELEHPA